MKDIIFELAAIAVKDIITEAANQTSQDTATFANALAEYAAIVKAVKEDYNGKATVSIIREEHPELDFMDDSQIQEIIDQGNEQEVTTMTRYEKIKEALEAMDTSDIISIHNEYCNAANFPDNYIYCMDEFDDIMQGRTPWEIARCCYYDDFCPAHDYFRFNGYANLESFDFAPSKNSGIFIDDIADYIDRTEDTLNNADIEEILKD